MFKCGLLTTTTFVIVGTISFLAAQSAAAVRAVTASAARDRNNEFLCTYGGFNVSYTESQESGFYSTTWTHVAVPFTGHGNVVDHIIVKEGQGRTQNGKFYAAIYSNSKSGVPGTLLAQGEGRAPQDCAEVSVSIPPTSLKNKRTYWIVESVSENRRGADLHLFWAINRGTKHRAYVQHYSSASGTSSTTPWEKQHSGPWFRLK